MQVRVLYLASLKETAGRDSELVESNAQDLRGLYLELQQRYGFTWTTDTLRVAVDGEFTQWTQPLGDACEIAFIPPVSGG